MDKREAARLSAKNEIKFKRDLVSARKETGTPDHVFADKLGITVGKLNQIERLDYDWSLTELREYLTQCKASISFEIITN